MANNEVKLKLSVDGAAQVVSGMDAVSGSMKSMETAAGYAKSALIAFAGVASISALKGMVQGSIEASAGLHDMAMQTGASVAALTAFRAVASTTNTSIDGIANAMNRAAKSMAVANEDSKGIGQAIKALGLDFGALQKLKPEDQMLAVAKAMDGFSDGAGKSAAAMALYGKEGAKMLPFLKDLAADSELVTKKLTAQQVAAQAAQAAMADDYTDNLTKIKKASDAWKKDVSMALLPTLYQLSQAFLDVNKTSGGIKQGIRDLSADGSINKWAHDAVFGVTYVMDAFQGLSAVAKTVMIGIGATSVLAAENVAMVWNVMTGLLGKEPVINIINASMKRQKDIAKEVAAELDKTWGNETLGSRLRARITELQSVAVAAKAAKPQVNLRTPGDDGKDGAEKLSDYQKLSRIIAEKQAQDEAQLAIGRDLSESEKIRAKMVADITTGTVKLSSVEKDLIEISLAKLTLIEKQIAADKYYDEQQKARFAASSALIKSATDEADKNEALARTFGMTAAAIAALEIARLEEQLAQKTSINQCTEETTKLEALIAAKKRSAAALGSIEAQQANKDAATKAAAEWQKTADKINDSITDALMRGFESGKGFAENLRDTLTNMFKTMVLRPTVSAIVNPVAQGITGMMGLSGAANAAGSASGLGNLALLGGGGMAGSLMAGAGWMTGATTFGGALSAGASLVGTGTLAGGLSGLGMIAGALGPIALGVAALSMIGNKDKPTANTGSASANYDASGNRTGYQTYYGGSSASVDAMLASLQTSYAATANALGIITAATEFSYGGNTGKNGESPNFSLTGGAGSSKFAQGETTSSDAAISLAASRAVFAALQGSELPSYLSQMFNGLNAGAMTQEQITNTLAYAGSIKQVRDALLETREPIAILQANVDQAFSTLATTSESFKTDFVSAIDGGITPEKLAQWQSLQNAMTELASLAEKEATAKEAAAQKVREAVQREVDKEIATVTTWTQKLAVLQGTVTERQLAMQADLATTTNAATQELIKQVYAQEDLKAATQTAKDSLKTLSESLKSLSSNVTGAQSSIANLQLQAQIDAANTANAAAEKFRGLNKSLREFLDGETLAPSASFGKLLAKAMGGDSDAMQSLPGAATASIEFAKNRAATSTEFALQKAGILTQVAQAADAAALLAAQTVAVPQATDPMAQAITALETAVRDLRDGIAQSISVDLVNRMGEIDTNLSGSIDRLEFGRYFAGLASDATLQSIYGQLDTNGDGQITQLEAIRLATEGTLAEMRLSGTGGIVSGAGTYTGAQAMKAIAAAYAAGKTTAQIINDANVNLGVSSAALAPVAAAAGYTEISAYQQRIDATAALSPSDVAIVMGLANSRAGANNTTTESEFVKYLLSQGWNAGMGDKAMGWPLGTTNAWATANGFPAFAVGTNYVPRDMLAQIHEGEAIVPKAYNPAAGGNSQSNAEMVAELRALRKEVEGLRTEARATASNTGKTARALDGVIHGEDSINTAAA